MPTIEDYSTNATQNLISWKVRNTFLRYARESRLCRLVQWKVVDHLEAWRVVWLAWWGKLALGMVTWNPHRKRRIERSGGKRIAQSHIKRHVNSLQIRHGWSIWSIEVDKSCGFLAWVSGGLRKKAMQGLRLISVLSFGYLQHHRHACLWALKYLWSNSKNECQIAFR